MSASIPRTSRSSDCSCLVFATTPHLGDLHGSTRRSRRRKRFRASPRRRSPAAFRSTVGRSGQLGSPGGGRTVTGRGHGSLPSAPTTSASSACRCCGGGPSTLPSRARSSSTRSRRTGEIAVRIAIGAGPGRVLGLIVGRGLALTFGGITVGAAGALAATRLLRGLLFEIAPTDPGVLGGVAVLLAGTTLLACWLPARRATKVDPMVALRSE